MNLLKYRKEITSLRFFAIIPVLFYHLNIGNFYSGYLGVDVFFVISGYLICHKILNEIYNRNFSFKKFYLSRLKRLFPALGFLIFCINLISLFIYVSYDLKTILLTSLFSIFYISNFYFLNNTSYFDFELDSQLFLHTWSLSIEEQFYIFMPLFLFFILRKNQFTQKTIIIILVLLSFFACINLSVQFFNFKFYLLPFRIWEFLIGTLTAYYLAFNKKKLKGSNFISFCLLFLLIIQYFIISNTLNHPGYQTLSVCLITSLLIIYSKDSIIFNKFLGAKIFYFIGLISYSLYLWHDPLIKINKKIGFIHNNFFLFLVILLTSYLSYVFVENYFRFYASTKLFLLFSISTVLLIISLYVYVNNFRYEFLKENIQETSIIFTPNTTILEQPFFEISNSELKNFNEKLLFRHMFDKYFDVKSTDISDINFDLEAKSTGNYLENICFITGFGYEPSEEKCLENYNEKLNNILFIGDSTSHNYFVGFKNYIDENKINNVTVHNLTVTGCVPLIDNYPENIFFIGKEEKCEFSYLKINEILQKYHFDFVIMSYRYKYFYETRTENFIHSTSYFEFESKLKDLSSQTNLIVVGPSLLFFENGRSINEENITRKNELVIFSEENIDKSIFEINEKLQKRISNYGITYIPVLDYLCNDQECLKFIEVDNILYPIVNDKIHLTLEASTYFSEFLLSDYVFNR